MDDVSMGGVVYYSDDGIDWNANGWPEPNPGRRSEVDGYSILGMPDDIFDQWLEECDELDGGWEADY